MTSTENTTLTGPLLVEDRGQVRWLTFNRPEVHNAQDTAMLEELTEQFRRLRRDQQVRVLVLAGSGRSFCSGHDLRQVAASQAYRERTSTPEGRFRHELEMYFEPVQMFRELRIPTVCRVQGYCLAAGLMFASAADLVVAATDAVFGSPVIADIGVNDAEVASFALRVGERAAKQVLWLDERLDAAAALRLGLANWVVPREELDAKVTDVAGRLAAMPREALALSKESLLFMAERQGERDVNRFHFVAHQFSHQTDEARQILQGRVARVRAGASPVGRRR